MSIRNTLTLMIPSITTVSLAVIVLAVHFI